MAEELAEAGNWVGEASAEISGVKANKIWALVGDYGNIYKWAPTIESSRCMEDGVFRLVTGKAFPPVDGSSEGHMTNKIVELDPTGMRVRYQIMDNNVGFPVGGFVGMGQVKESHGGCTLIWSFVTVPISGFKLEDLSASLKSTVQIMAHRLEAAAKSTSS